MEMPTNNEVFNPIPDSRLVYRTVNFLLQPNETLPVQIQYQAVKVISVSESNVVKGRIGYGTDVIDLDVGLGYAVNQREQVEGKFYNMIELQNRSASVNTLVLAFAFGNISDDRVTIGGSINAKDLPGNAWNTNQVSIGNTAVQINPADSLRKAITIFAGSTDLYVGNSSGVTTANGHLVLANSSITLTHVAAVFGIRSGAAVNCTYAEETF